MTIEQKLMFGVEDVRGIRVECGRCHAALSFNLDETINVPTTCPACGQTWIDTWKDAGRMAERSVTQLIDALKLARRVHAELKPATAVRFEFDVPPWMAGRAVP
jgi:hypothetical protein